MVMSLANPGHRNGVFARRREKKIRRLFAVSGIVQKVVISAATRFMKIAEFDSVVFGVVVDWELKRCERSIVFGCFDCFGYFVDSGLFGSRLDGA